MVLGSLGLDGSAMEWDDEATIENHLEDAVKDSWE